MEINASNFQVIVGLGGDMLGCTQYSAYPSSASLMIYKGRSINKLQNSAILLICNTGKIRNIHFLGNLILNIEIFLMMTSLL